MFAIFIKEVTSFFSSLIGYIAIGVFLLALGLFLWVFTETSLLEIPVATLDPLFTTAPMILMFLLPAITMRTLAEEQQTGTIELLVTRPIKEMHIVLGKWMATLVLLLFAILPTIIYYITIYQLGDPKGNLDSGAILGSYFGLFLLGASFSAMGMFASSISQNQIVAFVIATFLCFFMYTGWYYLSKLPIFVGKLDNFIQMIGIDYHYDSISRGVLDSRDILYFGTLIGLFLYGTQVMLEKRKW